MKSTINILLVLILFFVFGCTNENEVQSTNADIPKLKYVEHISLRDTLQQSYYYNEDGMLQVINEYSRFRNSTYILSYTNNRVMRYGNNEVSYTTSGQIVTVKNFANYNDPERLLVTLKEYTYNSSGKISTIKKTFSDEYKAQLPEEQLAYLDEWEDIYTWENNNIKKIIFNSRGKFYAEITYEYDNSINYQAIVPVVLKNGAQLSENNVTLTTTRYAFGGADPPCFSCPSILEYDEKGHVIKINKPNEGFGGPFPDIKNITYID